MEKRLIDADALKDELLGEYAFTDDADCIEHYIDNAPTIDAVPVVHGEWVKDGINAIFRCSICNAPTCHVQPYCYKCGARMDGKEKDDE